MLKLNRVVVTGVGMVSPLGISVMESWNNMVMGRSGVVAIKTVTDDPDFPDVNMGLIPQMFDEKQWEAQVRFQQNNMYNASRLNAYAMSAVHEALQDSGLKLTPELQEETGVNIGIMNSNITKLNEFLQASQQKGYKTINRMAMLHLLGNIPTANISIKYGLKGPSQTACTACATGASAIGDSYRLIQYGRAKVMIAGGSEETFNPVSIHSAIRMQAMSTKKIDHPCEASRPFDRDRSGFILSEGSGVLILEEYEHAKSRKAKIYAEIKGYGSRSDGFHLTRPLDDGAGGLKSMREAIKEAQVDLKDITLINCHATSTPAGDHAEIKAIHNLFEGKKELLDGCLITAPKSQLGHTFGAAGAIESIFTILSLRDLIAPGILNLDNPISEPYVNFARVNTPLRKTKIGIKNSFGFGGVNVSLVFSG